MKTMIPRTYNDIMTLAGLQQLRQYCMISEETEANLFESFASGKLRLAEAFPDNSLKLTFDGQTEPMIITMPFNSQGGKVEAVTMDANRFNVTYSASYLASQRSSSGGGYSGAV